MVNDSGSRMLNQILHGLVDIGLLKDISHDQKKSICKLLQRTWDLYDCYWGHIVDVELAILLEACAWCGSDSTELSARRGYCVECEQRAQQGQIRWGENYLLQYLLEHRFGSLPRWVSEKLRFAPEEDLLHWGERLLDDTLSLEGVFSPRRISTSSAPAICR